MHLTPMLFGSTWKRRPTPYSTLIIIIPVGGAKDDGAGDSAGNVSGVESAALEP